ncbi:MAG: Mrp/NBP35 family ATP-binding protein, partial [Clostridiales bacterium]|nr:Mrp/NBP35 family ATP-binding protein [Clostridiales bacterium]
MARTSTLAKLSFNPLSSVKKVIGVISGKGGVGKSLVTALLASAFRKNGHNVAILD